MSTDDKEQRLMDLEDIQVRHERIIRLLREQSEYECEVAKYAALLKSAKRKLNRVTAELHDASFIERKKTDLQK